MQRTRLFSLFLTICVLLVGIGFWLYNRPLPQLSPQITLSQSSADQAVQLPWPSYGQGAFGASGFGVLASNNAASPVPIASTAKVITALAILKEKPLAIGQQGPLITITSADVQAYQNYLAKGGSVVPVSAGEQISEYQALQAMMLPSANNIALTTASWAFGSLDSYVAYANQFVKNLGLTQTSVADASGFSPQTVSTAKDLVILGEAALKNPVLAQIVNQSEADFPGVGTIKNINWLLGTDGVLGIKTGNTDQAGGCFLFAAKRMIDSQSITIIGAILGAPTRNRAMSDARPLIQAADMGFASISVVQANQAVGYYSLPWGGRVEAVAAGGLEVLGWKGKPAPVSIKMEEAEMPSAKGSVVGSIRTTDGSGKSVLLLLKDPAPSPPETWRFLH